MVLHNDKWDKKAKRLYMIKHGIKPTQLPVKPVKRHFVQNRNDQSDDSDDSDVDAVPVEDIVDGDAEDQSDAEEVDGTNNWRYAELSSEEEDEIPKELLKQTANQTYKEVKPIRNINKMSSKDLLNLKIGDSNTESNKNTHIKVLSEEDKQKFYQLQDQINKLKELQQVKLKFSDESELFRQKQKQKVLDLTDKDSYTKRVQSQLLLARHQTKSQITEDEFNSDLNELLGTDLPETREKQEHSVEELLSQLDKLDIPTDSSSTTTTTHLPYHPTKEDEEFLDELL